MNYDSFLQFCLHPMKVGIGDIKDAEIMRGIATRIFKINR
jgi:hypothetical protein